MKPLSYLIVFFLISIIISCGSETEEEILNVGNRRLISQKEYRTSYGSSELIKYEYDDQGYPVKMISGGDTTFYVY